MSRTLVGLGNLWLSVVMTMTPMQPEVRLTLGAVMHVLEVSDSELGRRLGKKPQFIQARRAGITPIRVQELADMADALGVPLTVLAMTRADAMRWIADRWDAEERVVTDRWQTQLTLVA